MKQVIKEIIEAEDSRLSDRDIMEILARKGIKLARRTVAKYRGELEPGLVLRPEARLEARP